MPARRRLDVHFRSVLRVRQPAELVLQRYGSLRSRRGAKTSPRTALITILMETAIRLAQRRRRACILM